MELEHMHGLDPESEAVISQTTTTTSIHEDSSDGPAIAPTAPVAPDIAKKSICALVVGSVGNDSNCKLDIALSVAQWIVVLIVCCFHS
jgi:hypothetical protein